MTIWLMKVQIGKILIAVQQRDLSCDILTKIVAAFCCVPKKKKNLPVAKLKKSISMTLAEEISR